MSKSYTFTCTNAQQLDFDRLIEENKNEKLFILTKPNGERLAFVHESVYHGLMKSSKFNNIAKLSKYKNSEFNVFSLYNASQRTFEKFINEVKRVIEYIEKESTEYEPTKFKVTRYSSVSAYTPKTKKNKPKTKLLEYRQMLVDQGDSERLQKLDAYIENSKQKALTNKQNFLQQKLQSMFDISACNLQSLYYNFLNALKHHNQRDNELTQECFNKYIKEIDKLCEFNRKNYNRMMKAFEISVSK